MELHPIKRLRFLVLRMPNARKHQSRWQYLKDLIVAEISSITRYYDQVIQWNTGEDSGYLLEKIVCDSKFGVEGMAKFPDLRSERARRTAIFMNSTFNYNLDIQLLLTELRTKLARTSRLLVLTYNPYLSWLYRLANWLRLRSGALPTNFVTYADVNNLARLAGYELLRVRPIAFFPWKLWGLGSLINWLLPSVPLIRWTSLAAIIVMRPVFDESSRKPTLSIVIPARNEQGNIESALKRMPELDTKLEIIFVEGHSTDGTWDEILRVVETYGGRFRLKAFQQTGKGKGDAVRLGFKNATGELLTILDADLTMPPELLGRFYDAYCRGLADFVNGTRLVYPMEGEAMRPLNRVGNVFFAKSLSYVLETKLGDSLCGTKLLARHDYERIVRWRRGFGDFDPFGDFELLFPAALLGLGIIDIPIRYRMRTYGTTNISRFRHGFMLLKMTIVGLLRIKMGRLPK
jgi:hypothetical protein